MDPATVIAEAPLFAGLPADQLEKVARIAQSKPFEKGEMIFSDGQKADGFYVVAQGRIKVFKVSLDGKEQILHIFGPGEPVGEVPVFAGSAFPAGAAALEKSLLLFFPKTVFVRLLEENTPLVLNMLAVLSRRLRQFTVQVENLSLKEVPGRLAGYLLFLAKEQKDTRRVELSISKGQLASLLGTIPETLSRILAKMRDTGLIEVEGAVISLLDIEGLELLAADGRL
ncbi:Crp/Fnr family transcriptional regulator [Desulfosudis oleivorans]|uniref:Transcriptional regulator, Crp/Fnr family n=1 Tax=Desulfosudis oleivorans (strain DSM 6200 / JCM 39069 / Hxd3) TaxID=96561 RepID=A8ZTX3_DESOH|nr:Crp/Fnr family transcriptional regulator [Desulfosudis oleivorans]ABW67906.1 transcriptional regulator, Crp/Fnr family [Desulfosudis oleivorans Hxd3]